MYFFIILNKVEIILVYFTNQMLLQPRHANSISNVFDTIPKYVVTITSKRIVNNKSNLQLCMIRISDENTYTLFMNNILSLSTSRNNIVNKNSLFSRHTPKINKDLK